MASSLAQVAPEGWIELCRRAWDQYSNGMFLPRLTFRSSDV